MKTLSPFVYWAQTQEYISLMSDLKNVTKPNIELLEDRISFSAVGTGAHGNSNYGFSLDLYSKITPDPVVDKPTVRVFDSRVEIILYKAQPSWWPRLTSQPQKPAWLKVNFDLWKSEDGDEDSEEGKRNVMQDYPGAYDRLHKEEMGYRPEDIKKVYLGLYNLFQFVGFTYVLCVMAARYSKLGAACLPSTYEHVGPAVKFLQLLQYLEVMHPMFGYTKGGVVAPLLQVTGRAIVLFVVIDSEPRMHSKPAVFYLFLLWSIIEFVRYPYYISQIYNKEIYALTWLRYSLWIPLYPLGILCESVIILRGIPYFEETGRFTVSMPNTWNSTFNLPAVMRLYLLLLTLPGMYVMMKHMNRNRNSKLKSLNRIVIKKSN